MDWDTTVGGARRRWPPPCGPGARDEDRRPRRRADRRLDRPGRPRGDGVEVVGFGRRPERLERAARAGRDRRRRRARSRRRSRAPTPASACAPVGALPDAGRGGAGRGRAGLRGHRRRARPSARSSRAIDDERFVGGHPIAGAETAGVEHARADLFEGAVWYLTPHEQLVGPALRAPPPPGARASAPARSPIDADTHDRLLAAVSHLPHVLANVLVAQAAARSTGGEALPRVGPSFRDATRVAGANTAIWTDIYLANREAIADEIDATVERLRSSSASALRAATRDAIAAWNDAARDDRRAPARGRPGRRARSRAAAHRPQPPGYRRPGGAGARQGGGEHRRHGARARARHALGRHDALDRRATTQAARARS